MSVAVSEQHGPYAASEDDAPAYKTYQPERLRDTAVDESHAKWAMSMHIMLALGMVVHILLIVPLIIWLVRREESGFIDDHGREIANVILTAVVFSLVSFTLIFIPVLIAWGVIALISGIRGAMFAHDRTYFRYPMVIRFI